MKARDAFAVLVAVGSLAAAPQGVQAGGFWGSTPTAPLVSYPITTFAPTNYCATSFNICVEFQLTQIDATTYTAQAHFDVQNPMAGDFGVMTGFGITAPALTNVVVTGVSPTNWTGYPSTLGGSTSQCNDLTGTAYACAESNSQPGGVIANGVAPGGTATFTFTTATALTSQSPLAFSSHIQSYGTTNCSIKIDSSPGGAVVTAGSDCVPTTTVPEPVSAILLATGLIGTGLLRRRRRGHDVTNG